jgi:hypothetical protein
MSESGSVKTVVNALKFKVPLAFVIVPTMLGAGVFGALAFAPQETKDMSPAEQTKRLNTFVPIEKFLLTLYLDLLAVHSVRFDADQQAHTVCG